MAKATNKILGPPCGYVEILNHETSQAIEARSKEKRGYFPLRPSSAGKCSRALAYELMEYRGKAQYPKKPMDPETHRLLALGSSVEWHVLKQFQEHVDLFDVKFKQQVVELFRLKTADGGEQIVEGSLDGVFWSPDFKCVFDVKSKKDGWAQGHKSKWDETTAKLSNMKSVQVIGKDAFWVEDLEAFLEELKDPFFSDNFYQLNGYACTEFLRSRGVDHAAVIQSAKNDSRLREVRFKPSQAVFERVRDKFQTVLTAVEANKPEEAPQDYVLGSIRCAFCPFAKECWGGGADALKAYFRTFPKRKWPDDVEEDSALARDFEAFEGAARSAEESRSIQERIVKELLKRKSEKVRLPNGNIWQVKQLKTEGLVLRRSKL